MIVFDTAKNADREAIKALWSEAFPEDESADIDLFLDTYFEDSCVPIARDGNTVVSMLFLLEQPLCCAEKTLSIGYVYGGATALAYRGQGIYRRLLDYAACVALNNGMAAMFLHPATPSLFKSYRRMGFTVPMTCGVMTAQSDASEWKSLTAADYAAFRRQRLREAEAAFVDWNEKALCYAEHWCRFVCCGSAVALIGERDGQPFAWEVFGALPPDVPSGRTVGDGETVGLMRWLKADEAVASSVIYMGYGLE